MKSIAIYVTTLKAADRATIERDMAELANHLGVAVTANVGKDFVCKVPALSQKSGDMPDFMKQYFGG